MKGSLLKTRQQNKTAEEAKRGTLPGQLVTLLDPTSVAAEDYRTLRTSILYASVDSPPKVMVVTSPGPREGKSTTTANLAVVLAQAGKNTLVVDCDLRRPAVHTIFGINNLRGVVNVLVGEYDLEQVLHEPLAGLKVLTVGPLPTNPAELLSSRRFAEFLDQVRSEFDYVLLDAPPVGRVSDPAILASQGDGALLVFDAKRTRKRALRKAKRSMEAVGARILGTVMNKVKGGGGGYSIYTSY